MPSLAAQKYKTLAERVRHLQIIASDKRIRPLSRSISGVYYHAALAAHVAAWEAYLEQLVRDFFGTISDPTFQKYQALHAIARGRATEKLEKFNTPNFDNSRELLLQFTGYDPYSDWVWPKRSMKVLQVQERLKEILKVRHSFAHGFSIPQYSWNTLPSGRCRLTRESLEMVDSFFNNLVNRTDRGMKQYIATTYSVPVSW